MATEADLRRVVAEEMTALEKRLMDPERGLARRIIGTDVAWGDEARGLGGAVWDTHEAVEQLAAELAAVKALVTPPVEPESLA